MGAREDTLAAVDQYWSTARQVHQRVACWALRSVHKILNEESDSGTIESRKVHTQSGSVREYRLPQTPMETNR